VTSAGFAAPDLIVILTCFARRALP
jgi:hypothetical protein